MVSDPCWRVTRSGKRGWEVANGAPPARGGGLDVPRSKLPATGVAVVDSVVTRVWDAA